MEDDNWYRTEARRQYACGSHGDDNIEVDDDAKVSHMDGGAGAFVEAWLWVGAPGGDDGRDEEGTEELVRPRAINADLLAACEAATELMDGGSPLHPGPLVVDEIRATITRAKGGDA